MNFKAMLLILLSLVLVFLGCAAQEKVVKEPPAFPQGVADTMWGMQVKEVKEAVETFQDDTEKSPFALYASHKYFNLPAILSYFFTPKSKRLYRIDVTFSDSGVYGDVRGRLLQMFKDPTYTQPDSEVFLWKDSSVLILQKNPTSVQIGFMNGPLLKLNNEEGGEPIKERPRESFWKAILPIPW